MKKFVLCFCFLASHIFFAQQKAKDYSNILQSDNIYEIEGFLNSVHPDDPRRSVLKPKLMELLKNYIKEAKPNDQRVKMMQEKLALLKSRPNTKISFEELNENIRRKHIRFLQNEIAAGRIKYSDVADSPYLAELKKGSEYTQFKNTFFTSKNTTTNKYSEHNTTVVAINNNDSEKAEFEELMNISNEDLKSKTTKVLNSLFDNDPTSTESIVLVQNSSDCNLIMRIDGIGNTKYRLAIPAHNENSIVVKKGDYLFTSLVCGAEYASQKTIQKALVVQLDNPRQIGKR